MRRWLLAAALTAAAPAFAQDAAPDRSGDAAANATALTERLASQGEELRMPDGEHGHWLSREKKTGAGGGARYIEANLIEAPRDDERITAMPALSDLVWRRLYLRLEAKSEDTVVDLVAGTGQVDTWRYVVSLDGRLLFVEHAAVPIEPSGPGELKANPEKGRTESVPPSDPDARKRWAEFSKELLTLRRTVDI